MAGGCQERALAHVRAHLCVHNRNPPCTPQPQDPPCTQPHAHPSTNARPGAAPALRKRAPACTDACLQGDTHAAPPPAGTTPKARRRRWRIAPYWEDWDERSLAGVGLGPQQRRGRAGGRGAGRAGGNEEEEAGRGADEAPGRLGWAASAALPGLAPPPATPPLYHQHLPAPGAVMSPRWRGTMRHPVSQLASRHAADTSCGCPRRGALCRACLCHATPCRTVPSNAVPCCAVPCYARLCCAVQRRAVLWGQAGSMHGLHPRPPTLQQPPSPLPPQFPGGPPKP